MLSKTIGGHVFGVEVSEVRDAGEVANGAWGYEARVEIYRDGACIGFGRWDVEGFEGCAGLDRRPLDLGNSESAAWEAVAALVREHLAALSAPHKDSLALRVFPLGCDGRGGT